MGAGASVEASEIRSTTAVESAAVAIIQRMDDSGVGRISAEEALGLLRKYETASETVVKYFPGARGGKHILKCAMSVLKKHGCNSTNTLFAQSICPDEINHEKEDITTLFSKYMGEVFHMGGLAGVPFTGKTGFAAFSHHVPDGGNLFILIAPHIGVSNSMKLGKYTRIGQERDGAACGAAVGALCHCQANNVVPTAEFLGSHPSDYQMQFLISEIAKRQHKINGLEPGNEQQAELARQVYDIAIEFMEQIVDTNFGHGHGMKGHLIILGGIQINMPDPMPDFFQPLMFEMRTHDEPTKDLLTEAFPGLAPRVRDTPRLAV